MPFSDETVLPSLHCCHLRGDSRDDVRVGGFCPAGPAAHLSSPVPCPVPAGVPDEGPGGCQRPSSVALD